VARVEKESTVLGNKKVSRFVEENAVFVLNETYETIWRCRHSYLILKLDGNETLHNPFVLTPRNALPAAIEDAGRVWMRWQEIPSSDSN
jgi:hypothetical protein